MRAARVRQLVHAVHLGRRQRHRRRVEPDVAVAVRAAPARARCPGWSRGAGRARRARTAPGRRVTCSKRRQADDGAVARRVDSSRLAPEDAGSGLSQVRHGGLAALPPPAPRLPARRAGGLARAPAAIAYGSTGVVDAPGRVDVGRVDLGPALAASSRRMNAVPRRSVISCDRLAPRPAGARSRRSRARRCRTPAGRPCASTRIERRTLSDQ